MKRRSPGRWIIGPTPSREHVRPTCDGVLGTKAQSLMILDAVRFWPRRTVSQFRPGGDGHRREGGLRWVMRCGTAPKNSCEAHRPVCCQSMTVPSLVTTTQVTQSTRFDDVCRAGWEQLRAALDAARQELENPALFQDRTGMPRRAHQGT
jgi:hypothetical protein